MTTVFNMEHKHFLAHSVKTIIENKEELKKTKVSNTTNLTASACIPTDETNRLLSKKNILTEKLEAAIILANDEKLRALLSEDFIVRFEGEEIQEKIEPSKDGKTIEITHTTSKIFLVRKNANILLNDEEMLMKFLTKAKLHDHLNNTNTKEIIFDSLVTSNSTKGVQNEVTNKLFKIFESSNYLTLMSSFSPALKEWTLQERLELNEKFNRLRIYTKNNIPNNDPKYIKAMYLCDTYQPLLQRHQDLSLNDKHNLCYDLGSKKTNAIFGKHRNLKFALAEMISFILGLGVIYLLVADANRLRNNGHFGLFSTPKTQLLVNDIEKTIRLRKM